MSKNVMIKNVDFFWAKLDKPVSPFGTEQFEVQVRTTDKAVKKDLEDAGVKVKIAEDDNGETYYAAGLKRKAVDRKGNRMDPPRVVDGARQPIDASKIGNGSTGNVILFSYDYEVQGRKGTAAMLTAVQVTKLVKYEGGSGVDFDIEDTIVDSTAQAAENGLDFG